MRKLFLLSTVFALSLTIFAQSEAEAARATTGWQARNNSAIKDVETAVRANTNEITERFLNLYNELRKMSEQATTVNTANTGMAGRFASASDQNRSITATEVMSAGTASKFLNQADFLCVAVSGESSTAKIQENTEKEIDKLIKADMSLINSEAGQISENGLVDFQRQLFQQAMSMCDPLGNGGANVYCSGSGTSHITLSSLLRPTAYRSDPRVNQNLDYLKNILYARIPISVNPDLLVDPNTETMNMVVESDRLKAEMSIGQTLFSMLRGNRMVTPGTKASTSLAERMKANGWSDDYVNTLTGQGLSKNSMYHALTIGSFGSEFMMQQLSGNDDINYGVVMAKELMLNNVLQYEQYKLLEAIALATATNIVVNRDDAIKDLNERISSANSRQ